MRVLALVTLEALIETMLGTEIVDETDRVVDLQKSARQRRRHGSSYCRPRPGAPRLYEPFKHLTCKDLFSNRNNEISSISRGLSCRSRIRLSRGRRQLTSI
jgi:hypothetical protein